MRRPLVGLGMGIGARLRPAAAQGSVVSPESGVLSPGVDYRPIYQAQKYQGGSGVLTESLGRPELYRRRDHGDYGGAAETERGVRAVLGLSGVLGCTGRRAMPLRSKTWGQIGPIRTGGE